ncbi:hypothetical protein [Nostoc sp.]
MKLTLYLHQEKHLKATTGKRETFLQKGRWQIHKKLSAVDIANL